MPWFRIDYRADAEWAEHLQQQIEEAERQDRLRNAYLASMNGQSRRGYRQEDAR